VAYPLPFLQRVGASLRFAEFLFRLCASLPFRSSSINLHYPLSQFIIRPTAPNPLERMLHKTGLPAAGRSDSPIYAHHCQQPSGHSKRSKPTLFLPPSLLRRSRLAQSRNLSPKSDVRLLITDGRISELRMLTSQLIVILFRAQRVVAYEHWHRRVRLI
jgi:hypothetical protein